MLYIPPLSSYEYYKKCFKYISNLSNQHKPLIITGDFNLPDIDWSILTGGSAVTNELCNTIFELNLLQHNDQPTHIKDNTLDLILSSSADLVHSLKVLPNHQASIQSDYYIITIQPFSRSSRQVKKRSPHYVYNFGLGDYPGLCSHIHNKLLEIESVEGIEEIWTTIKEAILSKSSRLESIMRVNLQIILHQTITTLSTWYINNFKKAKSFPETLYLQSQPTREDLLKAELFNKYFHSIFTKTSTEVSEFITSSSPDDHNSLSEVVINEDDFYIAMCNLDSSKATGYDGIGPKILKICASSLYKPLHYLFTKSLQYCQMPTDWLTHIIVSVYMSGD